VPQAFDLPRSVLGRKRIATHGILEGLEHKRADGEEFLRHLPRDLDRFLSRR
jgi:hypothetical protein